MAGCKSILTRTIQNGGYRVSHDRGAVTLGNEATAFADAQNCHGDVIGDFPVMTSTITLVWAW